MAECAGTLDDPEIVRAPSWACIDNRLPSWDGQPPPAA